MEHGVIIPFAMFALVGVVGRVFIAMIGLGCGAPRRRGRAHRGLESPSSPLGSDR